MSGTRSLYENATVDNVHQLFSTHDLIYSGLSRYQLLFRIQFGLLQRLFRPNGSYCSINSIYSLSECNIINLCLCCRYLAGRTATLVKEGMGTVIAGVHYLQWHSYRNSDYRIYEPCIANLSTRFSNCQLDLVKAQLDLTMPFNKVAFQGDLSKHDRRSKRSRYLVSGEFVAKANRHRRNGDGGTSIRKLNNSRAAKRYVKRTGRHLVIQRRAKP
jgi:hypothetical protein